MGSVDRPVADKYGIGRLQIKAPVGMYTEEGQQIPEGTPLSVMVTGLNLAEENGSKVNVAVAVGNTLSFDPAKKVDLSQVGGEPLALKRPF